MKQRVVVTGMGIVSALGSDVDTAWKHAVNGESGIQSIQRFDTSPFKVKVAAEVQGFEPEKHLSKQDIRRQDLFSQYAVYASKEAYEDANLNPETLDAHRIGCVIGSGMGGMTTFANTVEKAHDLGYRKVSPMFIPTVIPNMAAGNVSIAVNAKGPSFCVSTACASAAHAIGSAMRMIQYGEQDVVLTGGCEAPIDAYSVAGFSALTALSTQVDPDKASRPFDKERDGFVLGEGAGILVLESLDHALSRGAKIYGELVGFGSTSDAYHITAPSGEGAARAMDLALKDANLMPESIDYINAHGTSTVMNDAYETEAIKSVFNEHARKLSISSTKSVHGHALGATAAIEAILSIKAMQSNTVPPTINLNNPDEACDLDYTPNTSKQKSIQAVMSNSLGFGGHNAVLVFRKYEEQS